MTELSNTQRNRLVFLQAVYPDLAAQIQGLLDTDMTGIAMANGASACAENGHINSGPELTEKMKTLFRSIVVHGDDLQTMYNALVILSGDEHMQNCRCLCPHGGQKRFGGLACESCSEDVEHRLQEKVKVWREQN